MGPVHFEAMFPDELWLAVLNECDMPTKLACSLTNRRFMRLAQVDSVWPPLDPAVEAPGSRKEGWLRHLHEAGHVALASPRQTLMPQKRSNAREVYRTNTQALAALVYAQEQIQKLSGLPTSQQGRRVVEECLVAHRLWGQQRRAVGQKEWTLMELRMEVGQPSAMALQQGAGPAFRRRGFSH